MNGKLNNVFAFAVGALIGSAVTWKLMKTKYESLVQEEGDAEDSTTLEWSHIGEPIGNVEEVEETDEGVRFSATISKPDIFAYAAKVDGLGYSDYSNIKKGGASTMDKPKPYVIPPEEFGENEYETVSLTFYADKILTDDDNIPVEDIDNVVGHDSLTTFGRYEDDSVFVRNDYLQKDFEILLDPRKYLDIIKGS